MIDEAQRAKNVNAYPKEIFQLDLDGMNKEDLLKAACFIRDFARDKCLDCRNLQWNLEDSLQNFNKENAAMLWKVEEMSKTIQLLKRELDQYASERKL